jgi:hypothetical protein
MQLYQPARNVDYGPVTLYTYLRHFQFLKSADENLCFDVIVIAPTIRVPYVQLKMNFDSHINEGKEN